MYIWDGVRATERTSPNSFVTIQGSWFFSVPVAMRSLLAETAYAMSFLPSSDSVRLLFGASICKGRSVIALDRSMLKVPKTWYWSFVGWIFVLWRLSTQHLVCPISASRREIAWDVMLEEDWNLFRSGCCPTNTKDDFAVGWAGGLCTQHLTSTKLH